MIKQSQDNAFGRVPFNVGTQLVAIVYAKAFLGSAENAGQTAALVGEFDTLVAEVLDRFPKFEQVLNSGLLREAEKHQIIDRVFGGRFSPIMVRFLKVLAHHGRLDTLRTIHQEVKRRYEIMQGRVHVYLSTAEPVNGQVTSGLVKALRNMLSAEPRIESVVEPDLIGGLVLRVGDTVYDGSVARQLSQVREQMINRSVHEIQSRRNRLRHSSGD